VRNPFVPQKGYVPPHGSQAAKEAERQRRADEQAQATRHQEMMNLAQRGGAGGGPNRSAGCFPAGTPIATPHGSRPIGEVVAGMWVLGFDRRTSTLVPARVLARRAYRRGRLWNITADRPSAPIVQATRRHPFLTTRGWVQTHALRVGDRLRTADAGWLTISSVGPSATCTTVYNLITENDHTYVAAGFVVHSFAFLRSLRTAWYRLRTGRSRLMKPRPEPAKA
jgi:hypothetical protein